MRQPMSLACDATLAPAELPAELAGIDLALGLELVSGKQALYLSLLRKFVTAHRETAAAVRRALAVADRETAELLVHNVKGVAGCLGATVLMRCAAALEEALRTADGELAGPLADFEAALAEVMADLESKLPAA